MASILSKIYMKWSYLSIGDIPYNSFKDCYKNELSSEFKNWVAIWVG